MSHKARTGRTYFRYRQKNARLLPSKRYRFDDLTTLYHHLLLLHSISILCQEPVGHTSSCATLQHWSSCLKKSPAYTIALVSTKLIEKRVTVPCLLQIFPAFSHHGVPGSSGTIKTSVSHTYPDPLNSFT